MKISRHVVVLAIISKLLSNEFFTSQNKILKVPLGLGIVFWFRQVFGLILMLTKNLSYLFKAFGQSGRMDFFFLLKYTNLFHIILFIYKKSECLKVTVFLVCSTCIVSPATFFFFECVKLQ